MLDLLGSVRFAVALLVFIALACIAGTLLPQGGQVAGYLREHPDAAARMEWLGRLGLTNVYASWWFLGLLGLFAVSLIRCGLRRFAVVRRTTGYARRRALGSFLTHLSLLLLFAGGVIRGVWGEKGYVQFHEGQAVAEFQGAKAVKPLPFTLRLVDFEIETYEASSADVRAEAGEARAVPGGIGQLFVIWPERDLSVHLPVVLNSEKVLAPPGEPPRGDNSWRIRMDRYLPDFVIDSATGEASSRSEEPNNPALLVAVHGPEYQNHRWVFARFPDYGLRADGSAIEGESPLRLAFESASAAPAAPAATGPIKSFKSTIEVLKGETVVETRTVEVNRPFRYEGYTFYQTGYNPKDLTWTSLQVVRDPSVPVIYGGFLLMLGGLFVVFYLNPWLQAKRNAS